MNAKASMQTFCGLFVLMSSFVVSAAPSITKVQGVPKLNETITIEGQAFSSPDMPVTQFWDPVENIEQYASHSNGDIVPASSDTPWSANGNPWAKPFLFKDSGNGLRHYYGEGKKNILSWPNINRSATPKTIYVSWRYKPSIHPNEEGGANKFIRIWDDSEGQGTRISWTQKLLYCQDDTGDYKQTWEHWTGTVGKWNRHEIYIDFNSGEATTWINNLQQNSVSGCRKTNNNIPLNVGMVGFDHGSDSYATMRTEIDEIYISGTKARVEIGNASTLSNSTIRQIQPISSWTNNKIVFSLHGGELDLNQPIYLYVFDSNGVKNESGVPLCSNCPLPPEIMP